MEKNTNERMLSEHFSLSEFLKSGTAIRHGIENVPTEADIRRMEALCQQVLEPLRRRFGVLRITSGFRCPELNRKVGGVANSQHLRGEAADIHISDPEVAHKMMDFLVAKGIDFDQCILEYKRKKGTRWLHLSYNIERKNRREVIYPESAIRI